MSTEHNNDTFERLLIDACKANLKPTIDPYAYATVTLDSLFNGTLYESPSGSPYYFEIPKKHTHHNQPVVVHLPH